MEEENLNTAPCTDKDIWWIAHSNSGCKMSQGHVNSLKPLAD